MSREKTFQTKAMLFALVFSSCNTFVKVETQKKKQDATTFTILKATKKDASSITLSWGPVSDAQTSEILVSTTASCDNPTSSLKATGSSTTVPANSQVFYVCVFLLSDVGEKIVGATNNPYLIDLALLEPYTLIISGTSSIADYYCAPYSITASNQAGTTPTTRSTDITVTLSSSASTGKFATSRDNCIAKTYTTSMTLSKSDASLTFYYIDSSAASKTLTASSTNSLVTSGTKTIQVNQLRVLGQATTTTNASGTTQTSMNNPVGVGTDGVTLAVSDRGNNRILLWSTMPASDNAAPDIVLGQPNFTSSAAGLTASSLDTPSGLAIKGSKLIVGELNNNRALLWNSIPTVNNKPADVVIGQADFVSNTTYPAAANTTNLGLLSMAFLDNGGLVGLRAWKTMFWNTIPTTNFAAADFQHGQPNPAHYWDWDQDNDGTGSNTCCAPTAQTERFAQAVATFKDKFILADSWNDRLLIWNTVPTAQSTPADLVLGQPNFTTYTWFDTAVTQTSMYSPAGVAFGADWLAVVDYGRSRLMFWNSFPTTTNQPATNVFGQPDLFSEGANNPSLQYNSLNNPFSLATDGTRLFITDDSNNRVLVVPIDTLR